MSWTTIRVKEGTKDELKDKVSAENMDERIQYLLNDIDSYIEEQVKSYIERMYINDRGEIKVR